MSIPLNADVQINIVGELYNQLTVTTFFYKLLQASGTLTEADPATIGEEFANLIGASIVDTVADSWTLTEIEVRDPRTAPVWASGSYLTEIQGVKEGPSLPPSVAAVITRKSELSGRRFRGRIFIPGVATSDHIDGKLTPGGFGTMQAFADDIVTTIDLAASYPGLELEPRVWSRVNQSSVKMHSAVARWILRSQRRREIGVGK
jgi:hypothetical protein